jgi:hypothetical protein
MLIAKEHRFVTPPALTRAAVVTLVAALLVSGCGERKNPADGAPIDPIEAVLVTSLHHTNAGFAYGFAAESGGFELVSGVSFSELSCRGCHVDPAECITCHTDSGTVPDNRSCLNSCHFRQAEEQVVNPDYHLQTMRFACTDCHSLDRVHGNGVSPVSMLESPPRVSCQSEGCHGSITEGDLADIHEHQRHSSGFECQACHSAASVTYYQRDMAAALGPGGRAFYGESPITDWKLLVRDTRSGNITTADIQTLSHNGQTFFSLRPTYSHTIATGDRVSTCFDCHASPALRQYRADSIMTLTAWDSAVDSMTHRATVYPIPLDWQSRLHLAFVSRDSAGRQALVSDSATSSQMLLAEPIDVHRMPRF